MGGIYQIKGAENVVEAYSNRDVKIWAVFQGKNLLVKGSGVEELSAFLEMISEGSAATYTLKVYDDLDSPKQVKEKTESDGSFNFILPKPRPAFAEYDEEGQPMPRRRREGPTWHERFTAIEEKIGALTEPQEPAEDFHSILLGYLKDPGALAQLIQAGKMLMGAQPGQTYQPAMQRIGNAGVDSTAATQQSTTNPPAVSPPVTAAPREYTEDQLKRLQAAIDILEKNDPRLIEHLEKLAYISQVQAQNFNFYMTALDNI